jgi:hypothetical protein
MKDVLSKTSVDVEGVIMMEMEVIEYENENVRNNQTITDRVLVYYYLSRFSDYHILP